MNLVKTCEICQGSLKHLYNVNSLHTETINETFSISYCSSCKQGYTIPFGINEKYYNEDNYGYERFKAQEFERSYRNKYYVSLIKKYATKSILDVGCMFGSLLKKLEKNYNVAGIELAKEPSRELNSYGIKCYNGKIEQFAINNNEQVDTLVTFHCLEHTDNIISFIKSAYKIIENKGQMIMAVPNFESNRIFSKYWGWILAPAHQYHFSEKSLKLLLVNNGFKIDKVIKKGGDASFLLSTAYNILNIKGGKKFNLTLFKIVHFLAYIFFSRLWFNIGREELIIVAKKEE